MADDLFEALKNLKGEFQQLNTQRTIAGANDAVQQIRSSELKDEEKTNKLRGVAEQLTYSLAAQGTPATTIEALTKYAPEQKMPTTAEQAAIFGTAEQQKRAEAFTTNKAQRALEMQQAKLDALTDVAAIKAQASEGKGDSKDFLAAAKFLQPDEKVRSALGSASIVKQNAERLKALVGNDLSDAALNKVPPQFVAEAAQGLARMVKGGVASEGEVKQFLPKNVKTDAASIQNYFTSNPGGAGQAGFLRLYMKAADREHALASQQIEDSVLQRAQGVSKTLVKDPDAAKRYISELIPGTKPEDVIIDPATRQVTTKQRLLQTQKIDSYMPRIKQLITQTKAANPSDRATALRQLNTLGIDPSHSIKQIQDDVFSKIKSGEW